MTQVRTQTVSSFDGTELAVHRMGEGRPVLLLHGLFSSAEVNWIKFGTAQKIVDTGCEAIMPDLRAHAHSDAPHAPEAYPADVLVRDAFAVVEALDLRGYDLVGFSLGSRTAARAVIAGLAPQKLALCGMGLEGLSGWAQRSAFFIDAIDRFDTIKRGDPAYFARSFMKTMNVDRTAARLLLQSVDDTAPEALARITMPTTVICGADDHDNGSATALAEALPDGRYVEVPGTHMSSVANPRFGDALAQFVGV